MSQSWGWKTPLSETCNDEDSHGGDKSVFMEEVEVISEQEAGGLVICWGSLG